MKTPTAHELATAITRNVDLFWNRHINYESFTALAVSLWDDARQFGIHGEVERIVRIQLNSLLVSVDARSITRGTVFVLGGLECKTMRVRASILHFLGEDVPATEVLYSFEGCDTPQMRTFAHGAKLSVRP